MIICNSTSSSEACVLQHTASSRLVHQLIMRLFFFTFHLLSDPPVKLLVIAMFCVVVFMIFLGKARIITEDCSQFSDPKPMAKQCCALAKDFWNRGIKGIRGNNRVLVIHFGKVSFILEKYN